MKSMLAREVMGVRVMSSLGKNKFYNIKQIKNIYISTIIID